MGAWRYMEPRLRALAGPDVRIAYVGRPERASPAEGYASAHEAEQARIVREALAIGESTAKRTGQREKAARS